LPARLVASNPNLLIVARLLVVGVVGVGFDVGDHMALIDRLSEYILWSEWEVAVTHGPKGSNTMIYPRVDALIEVLGGNPSTEQFPSTRGGRAAGSLGDVRNSDHVKLAATNLEAIMVQLFHVGGRSRLNGAGNFGIAALIVAAVARLGLDRAKDIFGTLLTHLHRAVHVARTQMDGALALGHSPLDIIEVVTLIQTQALASAGLRQQSDESVDDRLAFLGVSPELIQQTAAAAAKAAAATAAKVAVDAAVKSSRWGPPGPDGAGGGAINWLDPVTLFEAAQLADPAIAKACPWWCLYTDCKQARENKCVRCKDGVLCPQAVVDKVKAASSGPVVAKIVGLPSGPNPSPGDGSMSTKGKKRKP
jgi:hypothetical protein